MQIDLLAIVMDQKPLVLIELTSYVEHLAETVMHLPQFDVMSICLLVALDGALVMGLEEYRAGQVDGESVGFGWCALGHKIIYVAKRLDKLRLKIT